MSLRTVLARILFLITATTPLQYTINSNQDLTFIKFIKNNLTPDLNHWTLEEFTFQSILKADKIYLSEAKFEPGELSDWEIGIFGDNFRAILGDDELKNLSIFTDQEILEYFLEMTSNSLIEFLFDFTETRSDQNADQEQHFSYQKIIQNFLPKLFINILSQEDISTEIKYYENFFNSMVMLKSTLKVIIQDGASASNENSQFNHNILV